MSTKRYWDPTGHYVASFGKPWRRAAAAGIDWALCYVAFLVVSIPLGAMQALGSVSWEEGDLGGIPGHVLFVAAQVLTIAPIVAYFGALMPSSQTLGMRALELRLVSMRTGRAPSRLTASVRGAIAIAGAAGVYAVYLVSTSYDPPRNLDTASRYALDAAYVLTALVAASALTMIATPTHRSIVDRLFGTGVVDDLEALVPQMGPWGPLDAFELSHDAEPPTSQSWTRSRPSPKAAQSGK